MFGTPMDIEPPYSGSDMRSSGNELVEKYLAGLEIDNSKFPRVKEAPPNSVVYADSAENFVAKLMAALQEPHSQILPKADFERFIVKPPKSSSNVVTINVAFCRGEDKTDYNIQVEMVYDNEDRLVLTFYDDEEAASAMDYAAIHKHIVTSLKEL